MPTDQPGRSDRLHQLLDAVLGVASDLSLSTVLQRIVDSAATLIGAQYVALGVIGPDRHLSDFVTFGASAEMVAAIGNFPEGHGILGLLIVDPRPLRLKDLTTHPDSYGFPPNHPRMRSFLGVPIRVRDEVFGNLYFCEKIEGGEFTQDDETFAVALAAVAGMAIENTWLHNQLQEVAVLSDRERIARDLHDKVIQRLFATGMGLEAASRLVNGEVAGRLEQAVTDLDGTIREIRSTIFALETRPTERGGLRAKLLALIEEMTEQMGTEPTVQFDGPVDTSIETRIGDQLLAALHEALSNVAQHAAATRVDVAVMATPESAVLTVADNGRGLPESHQTDANRGRGLLNMTKRAEDLGGTCTIQPAAGGGTLLQWRVPLTQG